MSASPQHHSTQRPRRRCIAVIGDNALDAAAAGDEQRKHDLAFAVGRAIVDAGHRVLTGGLGGVMEAAMCGARGSPRHADGDTIAVLPGDDPAAASAAADVVICTGLGAHRNGVVGRADGGVIAVGGGAGTLIEAATAWKCRRPVVVMRGASGCTAALAGAPLDARGGSNGRVVVGADDAGEAVRLLMEQW